MAQDHGAVEDKVADATLLPEVDVAAANASLLDVDADIVLIAEGGDLTVLERDVLDGLEDESVVLYLVSAKDCIGLSSEGFRRDSQCQPCWAP